MLLMMDSDYVFQPVVMTIREMRRRIETWGTWNTWTKMGDPPSQTGPGDNDRQRFIGELSEIRPRQAITRAKYNALL